MEYGLKINILVWRNILGSENELYELLSQGFWISGKCIPIIYSIRLSLLSACQNKIVIHNM